MGVAARVIEFTNLETEDIDPNQRASIVGSPRSQKSSLALALFRFLEIGHGRLYIGGIDVSKIKLHLLKSRLTMIPQDPELFSGTASSKSFI